jgi:hypothetical protein
MGYQRRIGLQLLLGQSPVPDVSLQTEEKRLREVLGTGALNADVGLWQFCDKET